jgi:hypothetical protein
VSTMSLEDLCRSKAALGLLQFFHSLYRINTPIICPILRGGEAVGCSTLSDVLGLAEDEMLQLFVILGLASNHKSKEKHIIKLHSKKWETFQAQSNNSFRFYGYSIDGKSPKTYLVSIGPMTAQKNDCTAKAESYTSDCMHDIIVSAQLNLQRIVMETFNLLSAQGTKNQKRKFFSDYESIKESQQQQNGFHEAKRKCMNKKEPHFVKGINYDISTPLQRYNYVPDDIDSLVNSFFTFSLQEPVIPEKSGIREQIFEFDLADSLAMDTTSPSAKACMDTAFFDLDDTMGNLVEDMKTLHLTMFEKKGMKSIHQAISRLFCDQKWSRAIEKNFPDGCDARPRIEFNKSSSIMADKTVDRHSQLLATIIAIQSENNLELATKIIMQVLGSKPFQEVFNLIIQKSSNSSLYELIACGINNFIKHHSKQTTKMDYMQEKSQQDIVDTAILAACWNMEENSKKNRQLAALLGVHHNLIDKTVALAV